MPIVPAPVSAGSTWPGATPPARWAAGTVPPPVLERPLPSLFAVVARIKAVKAGLPPPAEDDVEVIHVDLDDDEILLGEEDITLID